MGNLQSVVDDKNIDLSFKQYDKDLPIFIKKIDIIYSKRNEDHKYTVTIEKENELKLLLGHSEYSFSKKSINFQNSKFHLARYLSTFEQTSKLKKIPKKIPKDVFIAIDEIDFTFKFTIQVKVDKNLKARTLAFCNTGSIMDVEDILSKKLKEFPNIEPSPYFSIVDLNLIENKKNSNIYEWSWNYIPPPNAKDAAYPGNGGWRNICCFVEYDQNSKEFSFHKGFNYWTLCPSPSSAICNPSTTPIIMKDGIYRNHSICIGGTTNVITPSIQLNNEPSIKEEDSKMFRKQSTKTSIGSYKIRDISSNSVGEFEKSFAEIEPEFITISKSNTVTAANSGGFRKTHNAQLSLDINVNRNYDNMILGSAINSSFTSNNIYSSFASPSVINMHNIGSGNANENHNLLCPTSIPNGSSNLSESSNETNFEELNFDGPVFRDTISNLEWKILKLKETLKILIKQAEDYMKVAEEANNLENQMMDTMMSIPIFSEIIKNYIKKSKTVVCKANEKYLNQIQNLVITPLTTTYQNDFDLLETKKKDFEQESNEYYSMLTKYLSCKYDEHPKKKAELDLKLQTKKQNFDLNRYDYLTYLMELNEGQKAHSISFAINTFLSKQFNYYKELSKYFMNDDTKNELKEVDKFISDLTITKHAFSKERQEKRKTYATKENNEKIFCSIPSSLDEISKNETQRSKFKGIRDLYHINNSDDESTQADEIKGFLFSPVTNSSSINKTTKENNWKMLWCVIKDGHFYEYNNWKTQKSSISNIINIQFCTVREARNIEKRRFCFELVGPQINKKIYQATNEKELNRWINVIQNSIEGQLKSNVFNAESEINVNNDANAQLLEMFYKNLSNKICADCGAKNPEWCSINLGCILCIDCSGIHRSLGTHITKIRSLTLDTVSWTKQMQCMINSIGNQISNSIWEATLESSGDVKPTPMDSREKKESFIRKKYIDKAYVDVSEFPRTPSEQNKYICNELYDAIISLNHLKILHCIALGANNKCLSDENYESKIISALYKICKYPPPINFDTATTTTAAIINRNNSENETGSFRENSALIDSSFLSENNKRRSIILCKENSLGEKQELIGKYSHSHNPSCSSYSSCKSFSTTIQGSLIDFNQNRENSKLETDSYSIKLNNDYLYQDPRIQYFIVSVLELIFQNFNVINITDDVELDNKLHHSVLFTENLQPDKTVIYPKRTLLHYASLMVDPERVSYFIQKGANPLIKDKYGFTPLDILKEVKLAWKSLNCQYNPTDNDYNLCEELLNNAIEKTNINNS